jgi:membrane dipeptidase
MTTRRQFLIGSGSTLLISSLLGARALRAEGLQWPPYATTLVIDGAGGPGRSEDPDDGKLSPRAVADLRESGLSAAVLTVAPNGPFRFGADAFETTVKTITHWDREVEQHPKDMCVVRTLADLLNAKRDGKMGLIYGFQETSPIGEDSDRIDLFQSLGVRVIQLTHNKHNLVGDGCMEPGNAGLSDFGLEVIERLNERKVIVDLAHGGERTTREAIAASKSPVLISHTGCRALSDLPRCATDANLKAMADRGGVAGIIFWPYLRKQGQPMAEDLIRHIEYAINLCGEDHVGIGTDTYVSPIDITPQFKQDNRKQVEGMIEDGVFEKGRSTDLYMFIPDLNHLRRFETLGAMLSRRGHSDTRIAKVLGGNFARVMGEVWG